jgi:hypothetical protein
MARSQTPTDDAPTAETIAAAGHPDRDGDRETAVAAARESLSAESTLVFDIADEWVALENDTVRFTASLDARDGWAVERDTGALYALPDDGGPVLVAEGAVAVGVYRDSLTTRDRQIIQESRTDALWDAGGRAPGLSVGDRNPGLGSR